MNEKLIERKLRDDVKALGGLALKLWPMSYAGLPDRIVLLKGGKMKFAELKSTGKKPTLVQLAAHRKLEQLGFPVWVIDSEDTLAEFLVYCENVSREV